MVAAERRRASARQGIARALTLLALSVGLLAACAARDAGEATAAGEPLARLLDALPAAAPGTLVVRLAFGPEADLDLYVTGPFAETVYYGNTPSRIGARLDGDRRCDAAAPRIETVVFDPAPPGPYRVGIDFPEPCVPRSNGADYALSVQADGQHAVRRGRLEPGVFEPIVLEWVHGAAAPRRD